MDGEEHQRLEAVDDVENSKIAQKQILETEEEKRARLLSLRIIYFTMFLMTLGFSIILTGIWPYLDKVITIYEVESTRYRAKSIYS